MADLRKLPGDTVEGTDPLVFALAFVTAMRKQRGLTQVPSLRTTLAIPRFVAARWFRLRALTPRDYLDAAVLCTPAEDQHVAERVAREILFPKPVEKAAAAVVVAEAAPAADPGPMLLADDPMGSILGDLAGLDIDLDALTSLGDVDALLDAAEKGEFRSFDLYESLHQSPDVADRAAGRLINRFGGPGELEANGITDKAAAIEFAREHLRATIGELLPDDVVDGCAAGFGALLLREIQQPWELAGALAGNRDLAGLGAHLKDLLTGGTTREIGRTLKFLEPHAGVMTGTEFTAFRDTGLARARDLADHAELLDGLGRWIPPDPELLKRSARDNITRALAAARWLEKTYGEPLQVPVFEHWADGQDVPPTLETLLDLVVPAKRWEALMDDAYGVWMRRLAAGAVNDVVAAVPAEDWN